MAKPNLAPGFLEARDALQGYLRRPNPTGNRWAEVDHEIRNLRDGDGEHVDTPAHRRSAGRMASARSRAGHPALTLGAIAVASALGVRTPEDAVRLVLRTPKG